MVVVYKSLVYKVLCEKFSIRKCIICNVLVIKDLKSRYWVPHDFPKFSAYGKIGFSYIGPHVAPLILGHFLTHAHARKEVFLHIG